MKLGRHKLKVIKTGQRVILSDGKEEIELKELKEKHQLKVGDEVSAFIYDTSKDKRVATLEKPYVEVGEIKELRVVGKTGAGYFVDIGLDKDIFLPYQERVGRIDVGSSYLMMLYIDKSDRYCVTMNIKEKLKRNDKFKVNDIVKGKVYLLDARGAHIAIDSMYDGLVVREEVKGIYKIGDEVEARVQRILKDNRITLTFREKAYKQMNSDADMLLELIEENDGVLNIGDKTDSEIIKHITGLSKSAFKRAEGSLYKQRKIEIYPNKIVLKNGN